MSWLELLSHVVTFAAGVAFCSIVVVWLSGDQ
jgi:hypothetical protein